jgi:lipoprotein NlpD
MMNFLKLLPCPERLWICAMLIVLASCSGLDSSRRVPAPVEERKATKTQTIWSSMPQAKPAPERMGSPPPDQPGFYTVRQGDTLIRIGLDQGQNWRDLARWNNLDNPNSLEVGQQLRVQAPTTSVQSSAAVPSYSSDSQNPGVIVQPVTSTVIVPPASTALSSATSAPAGAPNPTSPRPSAVATPSAMPPALEGGDELSFAWPSHGNVISYFDENKTLKGLDIGGKTGDAVLAAADGKVVYAGNGLRGYGNLVILKHNNTYLSAYAHNQTLLVKEDQSVKRGQKIAEMGSTDSEQVNLHFEIRKLGKPVDPLKFLPPH